MNSAYTISNETIILSHEGRVYVVPRSAKEASPIINALRLKQYGVAVDLADKALRIVTCSGGRVTVQDGVVFYKGNPVHNTVCTRILDFVEKGLPFDPLVAFLENLLQNPSNRSIQELYKFLEHKHLPITEDGHFLAYKSVRNDYYSKYSGSLTLLKGKADAEGHIFNGVGETILCPRNEVDDDFTRECSQGLHCGSLEYSGPNGWYHSAGERIVIVKVHPMNAVSVPNGDNTTKLRTCGYEVVTEFKEVLSSDLHRLQEEQHADSVL